MAKNQSTGKWIIGENGRLQTVPNARGGCEVIIEGSLRFNPHRNLLAAAPELLSLAKDIAALTETGESIESLIRKAREAIKKATS
jgi:hypothetical protein